MKLKKKLKASIIEQLVALVIIIVILVAGFVIVGNITRSNSLNLKTRAMFITSNILSESIALNDTNAFYETTINGIRIEQNISNYNQTSKLKLIEIDAFAPNEKIIFKRKLVVSYE